MSTRRRLSKKQLKQDKFVSTTFELAHFVQEHTRKALIGLGALVVTGGIVFYGWDYMAHKESRAARLLLSGQTSYEAGNFPLAIADLQKITEQFSGTNVGDEASLMLADSYYKSGDYEGARNALEGFEERYDASSPLSRQAFALMGCTYENLELFEEAADAYLNAAKSSRFSYQEVESRIDAARAFRLSGDRVKAAAQCQYVIDHFADDRRAIQDAGVLLAEIEATDQLVVE